MMKKNIEIANFAFICVVTPFHEWSIGYLSPAGGPPTKQEGPSRVHVSVVHMAITD